MRIGVLALQGDVREHLEALRELGSAAEPVRTLAELQAVDALVLPGGESTTIGFLLDEHGLVDPLRKRIEGGLPVFGTCAGAILLAREVRGGDVPKVGLLDVVVERNAYGRQVHSFEGVVEVAGVGEVAAVFIRAPVIVDAGPGVEILAERGGGAVVVRQDRILATTFHPEIAGDAVLHRFFVEEVCGGPHA